MLARIRKAMDEREEGFTLIELLVVIIIIGILAAIAIPVFLSQRKKGYDAGVKSDMRNAATAEESYLTDNPSAYTSVRANLLSNGWKNTNPATAEMAVSVDSANGYCLVGHDSRSANYFFYDSQAGGLDNTVYTTAAAAEAKCTTQTAPAWVDVTTLALS